VWLTPLDEMATRLRRAGLVVTWQEDHSRAHRAMAQALASAFAADAADIAAQIGRRALDELLAAHRLWVEWLDQGRVRKLALAGRSIGCGEPPLGVRRGGAQGLADVAAEVGLAQRLGPAQGDLAVTRGGSDEHGRVLVE
jgi:hypothetical protein